MSLVNKWQESELIKSEPACHHGTRFDKGCSGDHHGWKYGGG
jgi:hypothetical protein